MTKQIPLLENAPIPLKVGAIYLCGKVEFRFRPEVGGGFSGGIQHRWIVGNNKNHDVKETVLLGTPTRVPETELFIVIECKPAEGENPIPKVDYFVRKA